MTATRWQTWVVVVANLAPLVLLSTGLIDLHGLLLAYLVETAAGVIAMAGIPRLILLLGCVVAAVFVVRGLDGSIGNIIVSTATGLVLAVVVRMTREVRTPVGIGIARVLARLAVIAAGLVLVEFVGDYEALDRAGWEPSVVESGLANWWATIGSSTTLVIAELSDLFGIPPAASPAILLIAFMTFHEGWTTWHGGRPG